MTSQLPALTPEQETQRAIAENAARLDEVTRSAATVKNSLAVVVDPNNEEASLAVSTATDAQGEPLIDLRNDGFVKLDQLIAAGDLKLSYAAANHFNWWWLNGQALPAADHPRLALQRPAWVSGTNIVLPDWRGRIPIGAGTFAALGALLGPAAEASRTPHHTHGSAAMTTGAAGNHSHSIASPGGQSQTVNGQGNAQAPGWQEYNAHNHGGTGVNGSHSHGVNGLTDASNQFPGAGANFFIWGG